MDNDRCPECGESVDYINVEQLHGYLNAVGAPCYKGNVMKRINWLRDRFMDFQHRFEAYKDLLQGNDRDKQLNSAMIRMLRMEKALAEQRATISAAKSAIANLEAMLTARLDENKATEAKLRNRDKQVEALENALRKRLDDLKSVQIELHKCRGLAISEVVSDRMPMSGS